jgi:translation initiation factor 2 beta subunit (eIF-2beta)/eIF-5
MEQSGKLYLTSDESVLFDFNYRYVISVIEIDNVIKKGTKITLLPNLLLFCEELYFDPSILIKIIGKKLSCKSGIDKTTKIYYLQGDFTRNMVKDVIYEFIQNYLLCSNCDKPEVKLKYKEKKGIKQKCKACGNSCYLNDDPTIDNIMKHLNNSN